MTTPSAPPSPSPASYDTGVIPSSARRPSIFSESTRFFGQPRLTKETVRTAGPSLGVDRLEVFKGPKFRRGPPRGSALLRDLQPAPRHHPRAHPVHRVVLHHRLPQPHPV